jgi:tetratricopeptide (TPR) repeat protein
MNEEKHNKQLQDYMEENMSPGASEQVEELLETNPELKAEADQLGKINKELKTLGAELFKTRVAGWEEEYQKDPAKPAEGRLVSFNYRTVYAVAASIALLITAGYFLFLSPRGTNSDLFTDYYAPYEDMILERGEGSMSDLLTDAMKSYNQRDFINATDYFNKYLEDNPSDYAAWLYQGISQMETENYAESEASLLRAMEGSLVRDQSLWYLGLMYVKYGQYEKA